MTATTTPLPEFKDFIDSEAKSKLTGSKTVQTWMLDTAKAQSTTTSVRPWCTLALSKLTEAEMDKYFDRSAIGAWYEAEYNKKTEAGKPFAWSQLESDLIFSLHRCMAARHRGRLMTYRDDCAQKGYHTLSAINQGAAKYSTLKQMTEKNLDQPKKSMDQIKNKV